MRLILMIGMACSAAGCFVARSGERAPGAELPPLPESVWLAAASAEHADTASNWADMAPDEIDLAALHAQTLEAFPDDGWQHKGDRLRQRRLVYSGLAPGGLLRVVDDQSLGGQLIDEMFGLGWLEEFVTGFKPNARFLSERELARQRERQRIKARVEKEEEAFAAAQETQASDEFEATPVSDDEAADDDGGDEGEAEAERKNAEGPTGGGNAAGAGDLLLTAGVDVGVPLEVAPGSRGVMVHLPALMGTKYEQQAVQRLRDLGWTILHVRGPTGVRPPAPDDRARYEADSRRSARAGLRFKKQDRAQLEAKHAFLWDPNSGDIEILPDGPDYEEITEVVYSEIPMPPTGLEARPGESPQIVAQRIAAAADRGLGETALAAEAALDALLELHPHLQSRPVVVIGFSAGAISAPAVAVRLADRVDAVVLIGGGADGLTVSQTSSITHGGVTLGLPDGPEPAPEFVEQVRAAYRELSQLDPYNAAPRLGGVPVLQVMARGDEMVPTEHQWTLWERLGRPDRITWQGPLGHKGLFYFLAGQMGRIDTWIVRQVGEE